MAAEYADDIWLNLSDQDLEDILSKYSDPKSTQNGTEDGTINRESPLFGEVSTVFVCVFALVSCVFRGLQSILTKRDTREPALSVRLREMFVLTL